MNQDRSWATAITEIKKNEIRLRGYRIDALMGQITFTQAIYLAMMGELPAPETATLLDAILVASVDHGASPPSVLAARTAAGTGAPLNAAIAAGVLSINRHHGGAIENSMKLIKNALERAHDESETVTQAATETVKEARRTGQRLPGFGHRVHRTDPRARRLFELAEKLGVAGKAVIVTRALESALEQQTGRHLPINVDGAIAALLTDLGFPIPLSNAFFIIARIPGLVAHAVEETTRERPMRRIDPTRHTYDGPPARDLGKNAIDTDPDI
ncbi:MAG: citryl-CoA lyase [Trueperaceae bacterium]|nr:MAG: citryl-CoA lyase [Trueperaceae bacterium]